MLPPPNFSGTIELRVTAVTQEADGGDQAKTPVLFPVNVVAVVDTPAVGGLDGHSGNWGTMGGTEDQPIALRLDPGLGDSDNSEKVVGDILIGNVPNGAVLKLADGTILAADANGIYRIPATQMTGVTLTMPHDSDQAATLTVEMTIEDTGGIRTTIGGHMVVDPAGDADTPVLTLTGSTGAGHNSIDPDDGLIPLHITATPGDTDGSESLYMWVRDVPSRRGSLGRHSGRRRRLAGPCRSAPRSLDPPACGLQRQLRSEDHGGCRRARRRPVASHRRGDGDRHDAFGRRKWGRRGRRIGHGSGRRADCSGADARCRRCRDGRGPLGAIVHRGRNIRHG